jgi:hypothetical protein
MAIRTTVHPHAYTGHTLMLQPPRRRQRLPHPPKPRGAAFVEEQELRQRALKRLRDSGLISPGQVRAEAKGDTWSPVRSVAAPVGVTWRLERGIRGHRVIHVDPDC